MIAKIIVLLFSMFKNKPGTADVLRSTEMFALQAAIRLPREDMAEPTITDNISELDTITNQLCLKIVTLLKQSVMIGKHDGPQAEDIHCL